MAASSSHLKGPPRVPRPLLDGAPEPFRGDLGWGTARCDNPAPISLSPAPGYTCLPPNSFHVKEPEPSISWF